MSRSMPSFTREQWKTFAKNAFVLLGVTAAAVLMIFGAHRLCYGHIARAQEAELRAAMEAVLPSDSYERVENSGAVVLDSAVSDVYKAGDAGYCVTVSAAGFDGKLRMLVGVDADGAVTKVHILDADETHTTGRAVADDGFLAQFEGKTAGVSAVKGEASENRVSAVAGATVSSRAAASCVASALSAVELIKEAANNG